MFGKLAVAALVGLAPALVPAVALAQPKFEYGKKEEVKGVEWKASAQVNLLLSRGNSRVTTLGGGAAASRKDGANKVLLEASGAYARSQIRLATDADASGAISADEIAEITQTTTRMWLVHGRYDRFFTARNSLYLTGRGTADEPAGNRLTTGAQLGYSRLLFKDDRHELAAEAGYDFSRQDFVAEGADTIMVHSARLFAGYNATLSKTTSASVSVDFLTNLNSEDRGVDLGTTDAFRDNRVLGKASFTTQLYGKVSFKFGFTLRYTSAPAPLPILGGIPYEPPVPLAEKVDTLTEASLIFSIL